MTIVITIEKKHNIIANNIHNNIFMMFLKVNSILECKIIYRYMNIYHEYNYDFFIIFFIFFFDFFFRNKFKNEFYANQKIRF